MGFPAKGSAGAGIGSIVTFGDVSRSDLFRAFSILVFAWAGVPARAEAVLPALSGEGAQQLQGQRERPTWQSRSQVSDARLRGGPGSAAKSLPADERPCFAIHRIVLSGAMAERFVWVVRDAHRMRDGRRDPWQGRCLGSRGLNILLGRMQDALVARGLITTRIVVAPQSLTRGVLHLLVVPGTLRALRSDGKPGPRNELRGAVPIRPGDVLNVRDIEQGLENLRRLPTVRAGVRIEPAGGPGATAGQSDVVIAREQSFPLRLNASVDNSGTKDTGIYNGSVTLSADDLLGLNDAVYVNATHDMGGGNATAKGAQSRILHVEVPFGYWMLGATASASSYFLTVASAAAPGLFSGETGSTQITLSRVVQRGQATKATISGQLWEQHSRNFIDGTQIPLQRRQEAGWQLGAVGRLILGRAVLDADCSWKQGTGAGGALPAPEQAAGLGTSRVRILTAGTSLLDRFKFGHQQLQYSLTVRGQWNGTPLAPLDRFAIGGRYTVRGFDGTETLAGDRGWTVRNELSLALPALAAQLYAGLDHAEVGGPNARYLVGTRLTGAVLGLRGSLPRGVSYDVSMGIPVSKPAGFITARQSFAFTLSVSI